MVGPYLEIRVCDSRGNTVSNEGGELSHNFEFDTLHDTIRAFNDAVDMVNLEFDDAGDEEEEEDETEADDVEEVA